MGKEDGKNGMGKGDKGVKNDPGGGFDGYKPTTESPGLLLLLLTFLYCFICLLIVLRRPNKTAELNAKDEEDDMTANVRRGVHGKKKYGGNYTKVAGGETSWSRYRVQISQGLGKQRDNMESIDENNVESRSTASGKVEPNTNLELDDTIPMWDKLSDKPEAEIRSKKRPRRLRILSRLFAVFIRRPVFNNRAYAKSVSGGKRREKKPLVESDKQPYVAPNCDNSSKDAKSLDSKNEPVHCLESSSTNSTEESSTEIDEVAIEKEMQEVFNLAAPWTVISIIGDSADFIVVLILSHYMGNSAMIVYSTVWFVLDVFNVLAGGVYGSCYKHVNNSIGDGNRRLAGEYIQMSIIINMIISLPASIAGVLCMETIMGWYGYPDEVIDISTSYAAIAALSYVLEGNIGMVGTALDIDGHAKFNAVYGLWESLISVGMTIVVIIFLQPSLFVLGIIHFVEGVVLNALYCYVVAIRYDWLNEYMDGLLSHTAMQNVGALKSVLMRSLPLLLEDAVGSIEWFILSMFAAHMGAAEAVVWILLAYIWEIIEIIPECYSEAVCSRVAYNLSAGNVDIAAYVASQSLIWGTSISVVLSILVFVFRHFIVWCISVDEVLEEMLLLVIPYISISQAFITLGEVATALNEALCLYHHAVKIMLACALIITLPVSYILTYIYGYNIEGLAAAVCMSCTTSGLWNLNMYLNADWERAVRKNQEVTKY